MANKKVVLVWHCKTEKGWRRFPALTAKNGKVRTGFVVVGGEERQYPEGRFQLRTYEGSRMVYQDAGENGVAALTAQTKEEHLLEAKASAKEAGVKIEEKAPGRLNLLRELDKFVQNAVDRGSARAAEAYRQAGDDFLKIIGRTYADEITEDDVLKHLRALRKRGQAPRTIHNRHVCIVSFLKHLKLDAKALAPSSPKYEKSVPEAYSSEELTAFFASVKDEHLYLTFELLLKTGLREREAVFLFWENIDLANGILRVRSKPDLGFTIKDSEERNVPIPSDLLKRLRAYRIKHPDIRYVIGTKADRPNLKLLRTLKRLVNSAGLNCGQCNGCKRIPKPKHKRQVKVPVRAPRKDARGECEHWWLHKFRSTCITQLLRSGLDLRTVMKFSGHSDLASVMRYLSPAGDAAIKAQIETVVWM
jgi:integrase